MKALLVTATIFLLGAATGARAGTMDAMFSNTVVVQTQDGSQARWRLNQDGTYDMTTPNGEVVSGTWALAGAELCITPANGEASCAAAPPEGKTVGGSWTATGPDGHPMTMTIAPGR